MADRRQEALDYHAQGRPGKVEVVPTKSLTRPSGSFQPRLLAGGRGALPARSHARTPQDVFKYTARGNLVAVVSNGTAVLGPRKHRTARREAGHGGKGRPLQEVRRNRRFRYRSRIRGPRRGHTVLRASGAHGRWHQSRGYLGSRLLRHRANAQRVSWTSPSFTTISTGRRSSWALPLSTRSTIIGQEDRGRAGSPSAVRERPRSRRRRNTSSRLGVPKRPHPDLSIRRACIHLGSRGGHERVQGARSPWQTDKRTLEPTRSSGADVFIGLSVKGLVTQGDGRLDGGAIPIIFALANPDPEILPEEVASVRDDAIMATGRSDYPNQVNNVLGFPFIFRGALDVRAKGIDEAMMLAATRALAELAREEVPETVRGAYEGSEFSFGREYLIPKPFDHRVLFHVAPAVAKAAMDSGLARIELDMQEYQDRLRASLGPGREVMRWMVDRARRKSARVVFSEGHNETVIRAAAHLVEEGERPGTDSGPVARWDAGLCIRVAHTVLALRDTHDRVGVLRTPPSRTRPGSLRTRGRRRRRRSRDGGRSAAVAHRSLAPVLEGRDLASDIRGHAVPSRVADRLWHSRVAVLRRSVRSRRAGPRDCGCIGRTGPDRRSHLGSVLGLRLVARDEKLVLRLLAVSSVVGAGLAAGFALAPTLWMAIMFNALIAFNLAILVPAF